MRSSVYKTRIDIDSLCIGMYLKALSKDDGGEVHELSETVHIISNYDEIEHYKEEGFKYAYVYTDAESRPGREMQDFVLFKKELEVAKKLKGEAIGVVTDFMVLAKTGKTVDTSQAKEVVGKLVDSVMRNKDALLSLARLKDFDNYVFTHSVNVCILSLAFARYLGMPKDEIRTLGLGAILHDIGKMRVPDNILNKPGALNDIEFKEVQKHVSYGEDILKDVKGLPDAVTQVALQHHERYNGSGYMHGLTKDKIHAFARIVAIADVYDAMTTERVYAAKVHPNEVLQNIYRLKDDYFEPEIVDKFILCVGIYPIGSTVKLDTGEVAIVKSTNEINLLRPVVTVISNSDGTKLSVPFDLDFIVEEEKEIVAIVDSTD